MFPKAWQDRKSTARATRFGQVALIAAAAVAAAWIAVGLGWLSASPTAEYRSQFAATFGSAMIVAGLVQGRYLWRYRGRPHDFAALLVSARRTLLGGAFVGHSLIYLTVACAIPLPEQVGIFLALSAGLHTAAWATVGCPSRFPSPSLSRETTRSPWLARLAWGSVAGGGVFWLAEAATRVHDLYAEQPVWAAFVAHRTLGTGEPTLRVPRIASTAAQPARVRVAVVGDAAALGAASELNFGVQVVGELPRVELLSCELPDAGLREFAAVVRCKVLPRKPALVMICVSAADDLLPAARDDGPLSWSHLRLLQCGALWLNRTYSCEKKPQRPTSATGNPDYELELDRLAAQLATCCADRDDCGPSRWLAIRRDLADMFAACRNRDVEVVLVVVPAPFQLDSGLWSRVVRRSGFRAEQLDVRRPQQRWAALAVEHQVPLIDLLPAMLAASGADAKRGQSLGIRPEQVAGDLLAGWVEKRFDLTLDDRRSAVVARQ